MILGGKSDDITLRRLRQIYFLSRCKPVSCCSLTEGLVSSCFLTLSRFIISSLSRSVSTLFVLKEAICPPWPRSRLNVTFEVVGIEGIDNLMGIFWESSSEVRYSDSRDRIGRNDVREGIPMEDSDADKDGDCFGGIWKLKSSFTPTKYIRTILKEKAYSFWLTGYIKTNVTMSFLTAGDPESERGSSSRGIERRSCLQHNQPKLM